MSAFGEVGWGDELTSSCGGPCMSGCKALVPAILSPGSVTDRLRPVICLDDFSEKELAQGSTSSTVSGAVSQGQALRRH